MRAQVFVAHSTHDALWRQRLVTMLAPLDRFGLSCWDETQIEPGQHRQEQIQAALAAAHVAVLLVSPDFLAFNPAFEQELSAILHAPRRRQRLKILWVPVRSCLWEQSALAPYQPAHDPNVPLASLSRADADAALVAICRCIHAAVDAALAIQRLVAADASSSTQQRLASTATDFRQACAFIEAGTRHGTGYLVRPDRLLTCHHVVSASSSWRVCVRFPCGEYGARVVAVDADSDCAVLQLDEAIHDVLPLPLATDHGQPGAAWTSYGFPSATAHSGLLIEGHVEDASGEDLQERKALILSSCNITAGTELHGFSGSPVLAQGQVIGQLRQVVPGGNNGAQFGLAYACPAHILARLLPPASGPGTRVRIGPPPPKSAYDAAWYLDRLDEEARAGAAWEVPGAPVVLQAPELFGKTWLLMRLLAHLKEHGRTVYIPLKTLGEETLATFPTFLRELARMILEGCSLPEELLAQSFARSSNPEANLNWLMSTQVLRSGGGPWLVLALDGVDALADKPYFDRFLTLLRGMAEQAAIPPWGALRLILTLSATMALRGQDIHRSPLENVAQIITLSDLSPAQVMQMAAWYGHGDSNLAPLCEYAGGHPYLVHLALHEAQHRKQPLTEILQPKSRVFDSYLQLCRKRLQQQPELYQALRAVGSNARAAVDEDHVVRLIDAGFLVDEYDEHDNRFLRLRYRIYRRLT